MSLGFQTWTDTKQGGQPQKMADSLKFWFKKVEELYYLCNENKHTDQLPGDHAADICRFPECTAHIIMRSTWKHPINFNEVTAHFTKVYQ